MLTDRGRHVEESETSAGFKSQVQMIGWNGYAGKNLNLHFIEYFFFVFSDFCSILQVEVHILVCFVVDVLGFECEQSFLIVWQPHNDDKTGS